MKLFGNLTAFALFLTGFMLFANKAEAGCPGELGSSDPVPTVWTKECSPYVIKTAIQATDPITIEPGVVVKFKYAASASFGSAVTAIGTEKEKIVFTAWTDDEHGGDTNGDLDATRPKAGYWYRILVGSSAAAQFENVSILYGGEHPWGALALQPDTKNRVSVKNSEFKHNKYAGIYINYNPDQIIEKNIFSDNGEGIVLNDCFHNISLTISENIFDQNVNYGAKVNHSNYNKIFAQNNWWGDRTGPYHVTLNPNGKGDLVSNGVFFDPWIGKEGPDPVIVIPGIMGSWEKDGEWRIDPIFHTFDDLRGAFLANGYAMGKNFFEFPYEWRDSNIENAKLLHKRIQDIKSETGRPKVDIVAHSMGGLLAREYIESEYFENDVDQLITVGTPHLGAPKDYIKWEAGAFFSDIFEAAGKYFFKQEAEENGYDSIFHYLRGRPMSSVQELLPVYNYLWDDNESGYDLRIGYPVNYPRNEFLENLNSAEKVKKLEKVELTKIIGRKNDIESTISGYNVVKADMGEVWKHGYPHGFEIPILSDQGFKTDDGDITVPINSAESTQIPAESTIYFQSSHNNLPTDAQQEILEILTGKRPDEKTDEWQIDDILLGLVFSPVDFQIVSPSGKRIGKNFETGGKYNEIEGAYYTGFDTDTEFLTIPNPEDGEYKILTEGTGFGEYTIEIVKISNDGENGAEESLTIITGIAEIGKQEETGVKIKGMKVEKLAVADPENKNEADASIAEQVRTEVRTEVSISPLESEPPRIQKLDNLKGKVRQYFKTGEIKTRQEARITTKKLGHIRVHLKLYETEEKAKKQRRQKTKANRHIDNLIFRINRDFPEKIRESAKDHIAGILEELKME